MQIEVTTGLPKGVLLDIKEQGDGFLILVHPDHQDLVSDPEQVQSLVKKYRGYFCRNE